MKKTNDCTVDFLSYTELENVVNRISNGLSKAIFFFSPMDGSYEVYLKPTQKAENMKENWTHTLTDTLCIYYQAKILDMHTTEHGLFIKYCKNLGDVEQSRRLLLSTIKKNLDERFVLFAEDDYVLSVKDKESDGIFEIVVKEPR